MFKKGSEWRQWDLHIHTPASYEWRGAKFNGEKQHDDRLVDEMIKHLNEAEPEVFALMDYFTFDGWFKLKKRLSEPDAPKLQKKVFPGIELRICAPKIRLNVHAIFSDEVRDQDLKDFLAEQEIEENSKKLSQDNLIHFIRNTGEDFLLKNQIDLKRLESDDGYALEKACGFATLKRENYISSIGKFDDCIAFMPWDTYNGLKEIDILQNYTFVMSIFKKSTIMESRNQDYRNLFLMKETESNKRFIEVFKKSLDYTPRLVVAGSDAHRFTDYGIFPSEKKTWIKADPTFKGLKQAIKEPKNRSYIGVMPEKMNSKLGKGSYFIDKISINKKEDAKLSAHWLNQTNLDLNHDLVAIIGKKGSGKSALADVISLLGNSKSGGAHFSFLKDGRFKGKNGFAKDFEATLTWLNQNESTKNLNDPIDNSSIEKIRYIPQEYFEKLCNANGDKTEFQSELNKVIFSYLDTEEKENSINLDELIQKKEEVLKRKLEQLYLQLNEINNSISTLESKSQITIKKILESKKQAKEQEILDHFKSKPIEIEKPNEVLTPEQKKFSDDVSKKELEKSELILLNKSENSNKEQFSSKINKLDSLKAQSQKMLFDVEEFKKIIQADMSSLDLRVEDFIKFDIDLALLNTKRESYEKLKGTCSKQIELNASQIITLDAELNELKGKLTKPNQEYQKYLELLEKWNAKNTSLIGSETDFESQLGIQAQLTELEVIPQYLLDKKIERKKNVEDIYDIFEKQKTIRENLYIPVQAAIENNSFINEKNKFEFLSRLEFSFEHFQQKFSSLIKQQRSDFTPDNIQDTLIQLSKDDNLETKEGVINFILLLTEKLVEVNGEVGINEMVRKNVTPTEVYNFLFRLEFIKPSYSLRFQETDVEQLSPGQRGALLLIFYLLVDKEKTPIVLDQPEENLDNDTVVNSLVPIITEAKKTRQIIMVTHNPNLAVVCDAEQIIYADFDRSNNLTIEYKSGSIESSEINQYTVNILEGTLLAFNNRKNKYFS